MGSGWRAPGTGRPPRLSPSPCRAGTAGRHGAGLRMDRRPAPSRGGGGGLGWAKRELAGGTVNGEVGRPSGNWRDTAFAAGGELGGSRLSTPDRS